MTDASPANSPSASSIPADDPARVLTVADPDGAGVPHISVAGGTYTILVSGAQTADAIAWSICWCPPAVAPRRIATTSRKCSRCSKANSSSLFAESRTRYARDRPSTFQRTPRTRLRTCPARRLACSACVRRQDRTNSFWRSVSRRRPHIATAEADPGRDGREGKTDRGPAAEISHRDGQDVRRTRLTDSQEWTAAAA